MLSRISNLGGGKFGVENAISHVENLGWKMLSRISNLGGGKFGVENAISHVENLFSTTQIRNFEIAFSTPNFPPPQIRDSR